VKPLEPGFQSVEISPTFHELKDVTGCYKTCKGDIKINWKKTDIEKIKITIKLPTEISRGIFIIPCLKDRQPSTIETENIQFKSNNLKFIVHPGINDFQIVY